jgi:hypothetical protein
MEGLAVQVLAEKISPYPRSSEGRSILTIESCEAASQEKKIIGDELIS